MPGEMIASRRRRCFREETLYPHCRRTNETAEKPQDQCRGKSAAGSFSPGTLRAPEEDDPMAQAFALRMRYYHIFEHLSTDNIVRFLFLENGVDSKQVES